MTLRTKLLLLLFGIGVLPLVLLTWKDQSVTRELGATLAERNRVAAEAAVIDQLQQAIAYNGTILNTEKRLMELALDLQVMAVEHRLAVQQPNPEPVHFAHEFDDMEHLPAGTVISDVHRLRDTAGPGNGMAVNYQQQSLLLAPGVDPNTVVEDIARLSTLSTVYAALNRDHPYLFYWQYTALASGVHSAFPGHGGYPKGFDPRLRDWYRRAVTAGAAVWSPPLVDSTTRQITLTHSAPVHAPDGTIAGVTGLDVPMLSLISDLRTRSALTDNIQTYLVRYVRDAGQPGNRLQALAYHTDTDEPHDWEVTVAPPALVSDDRRAFNKVLLDMRTHTPGFQRISFDGEDSLWVYGPIDKQDNHLLFIAPYRDLVREARNAERAVEITTQSSLRTAGFAALTTIVLVILATLLSSRTITERIRLLAEAAHNLAKGDFQSRVRLSGHDELAHLGRTFDRMARKLAERDAMRSALALAREVQQNLLPTRAPECAIADIAGRSRYCDETGGDYFDFIDLSAEQPPRIGVAVGDVSGHGISAALTMTTARALLRNNATEGEDLARQMIKVNSGLAHNAHGGRFMTLFYLVFELDTGALRWINAGHDTAFRFHPDDDAVRPLSGEDIPLGVDSHWQFSEIRTDDWRPGEWIVLFTDGVSEARNPNGEMFGTERLEALIRANPAQSAGALCDAVIDAIDSFRAGAAQRDDITLVVLRRRSVTN